MNSNKKMNFFKELPPEIIQYIMIKMDAISITVLNFVCKEFQSIRPEHLKILSKKVIREEISLNGYLDVLKWARDNGDPTKIVRFLFASLSSLCSHL